MRLPWIQVDKAAIAKCRRLAPFLKISVAHAIGLGSLLWEWALEIAPDGDFTGRVDDAELLASALEWPVEDTARLITQLQRVGLIATHPYLRVRGLDRYRASWEKNQRRNGKPPKSGGGVPATGREPGETARKTETETETETDKKDPLPLTPSQKTDDGGEGSKAQGELEPQASDDAPVIAQARAAVWLMWALDNGATEKPGREVYAWVIYRYQKHAGDSTKLADALTEQLKLAWADFIEWCAQEGHSPGWGLWLREKVGEYRLDQARAGELPRSREPYRQTPMPLGVLGRVRS